MQEFDTLFDQFIKDYIAQSTHENQGLITHYEPDWPSPCVQANSDLSEGDMHAWLPVKRTVAANMQNIEDALEINIPAALHYLFGAYYSHDLSARTEEGYFTFLQVWNDDDYERLQKNLIAHVLMKRRLKQDDTLFFALTDQEDIILSVDVLTQSVVVERVGKAPHKVLAENLSAFMRQVKPSPTLVTF